MKASGKAKPHSLKALDIATLAAASVIRIVRSVPSSFKSIADQAIRSASSFPLNLAEGSGRFGRDRLHHYRIAYGSGKEAETALKLLVMSGVVNKKQADTALQLLDRALAMTWRLMLPK